jgi:hypothetical protein
MGEAKDSGSRREWVDAGFLKQFRAIAKASW